MSKKLIPLVILVVWLLSNTLSGLGAIMLTIPLDGVPFPVNDTAVYLSSINVLVIIEQDEAIVNASYTFKNSGQEDTARIYIPYGYPLDSLLLWQDNILIPTVLKSNVTISVWSNSYEFSCVDLNITLKEGEQTDIFLHYQRSYHKQDAELGKANYFGFSYIIGTRNNWSQALESNSFEFRLAKSLQPNDDSLWWDEGIEYTVSETNDYLIVTYSFPNDQEFADILHIGWLVSKGVGISGFEGACLISSMFFISIVNLKLRKYLRSKYN